MVQAKRHDQTTRTDDVRSFLAVIGDDEVGILVGMDGLAKDAHAEARIRSSRHAAWLDVGRQFDLRVGHRADLEDAVRRRVPHKPSCFMAPADSRGPERPAGRRSPA